MHEMRDFCGMTSSLVAFINDSSIIDLGRQTTFYLLQREVPYTLFYHRKSRSITSEPGPAYASLTPLPNLSEFYQAPTKMSRNQSFGGWLSICSGSPDRIAD